MKGLQAGLEEVTGVLSHDCRLISLHAGPVTQTVPYIQEQGSRFLQPGLEVCGGSSGSCLDLNGELCCIGVLSGEIFASTPCGTEQCGSNLWYALSSSFTLDSLWDNVDRCF